MNKLKQTANILETASESKIICIKLGSNPKINKKKGSHGEQQNIRSGKGKSYAGIEKETEVSVKMYSTKNISNLQRIVKLLIGCKNTPWNEFCATMRV